jgi:glutamate dehydrogenase
LHQGVVIGNCGLEQFEASDVTGQNPADVAKAFFAVGSALDIAWYLQQISALPVENNWQALAREAFRDDVDWQQRAITISALQMADAPQEVEARLALWRRTTPWLSAGAPYG